MTLEWEGKTMKSLGGEAAALEGRPRATVGSLQLKDMLDNANVPRVVLEREDRNRTYAILKQVNTSRRGSQGALRVHLPRSQKSHISIEACGAS